jgi:hypothetical protein
MTKNIYKTFNYSKLQLFLPEKVRKTLPIRLSPWIIQFWGTPISDIYAPLRLGMDVSNPLQKSTLSGII